MGDMSRRALLKSSATAAAGVAASALLRNQVAQAMSALTPNAAPAPRLRFAVVGMNHGHIYGQVDAIIRGGGDLV